MNLFREIDNEDADLVAVVNDSYWSDSVGYIERVDITEEYIRELFSPPMSPLSVEIAVNELIEKLNGNEQKG